MARETLIVLEMCEYLFADSEVRLTQTVSDVGVNLLTVQIRT